MRITCTAVLVYFALTGNAFAYIDPGILAVLYQLGYALVLGAFAAFILRPWAWFKSLFQRKKREDGPSEGQGHHKAP